MSVEVTEPGHGSTLKLWAFWWGALIVAMAIAAAIAPDANEGFADGAAALAFIATVAVAIERSVEVFWTLVARSDLGGWWPLNQVRSSILAFEKNTDALLAGPLTQANQVLLDAKAAAAAAGTTTQEIDDLIAALQPEVERLSKKIANAKTIPPGTPRFALLTEASSDAVAHVEAVVQAARTQVPQAAQEIGELAEQLADACDRATDIVSSFSENPARKLLSLILGAIIGVLVAGFMGLNLFLAALEGEAGDLGGTVGIILTGVVLGFGANPTHEVISALQRKKADKTLATAPLGATSGAGVVPLALPGGPGAPGAFLFQPPTSATAVAGGLQSTAYRQARTIRRTD